MQTKHYFHELSHREKKSFFTYEISNSFISLRVGLIAAIFIITLIDVFIKGYVYSLVQEGKSHPINPTAVAALLIGVIAYTISITRFPRVGEKWTKRIKLYLSFVACISYAVYNFVIIRSCLEKALETENHDDWIFTALALSNCIHMASLIQLISSSWYHKAFNLASGYVAMIFVFWGTKDSMKGWILVKSFANILYMLIYVLLESAFRWKIFLKYSDAEAWNQVYNDTLDRMPSSIAVMNASGQLIYTNLEFKKCAEGDTQRLFRSITNLKLRDINLLATSEGVFGKASNEEFVVSSPRFRRHTGAESPYQRLRTKEPSMCTSRFDRLEDLLEYFRSQLASNHIKSEEQVIYDAKMEKNTLMQQQVHSYEIIIRPLVEYKKIVIILNNTTQRDFVVALEDNNDYKDKLLASVSHELRTPLNGNIGFLQAAIDDENVPKNIKEKMLVPALRSGRLLSHLINDLLDYSKMQIDKIVLHCEMRPLRESLEYCHQLLEHAFRAKELKFDLVIDSTVPKLFCTDHERLIQIILNLLSNALKFTYNGKVTVEAKIVGNDESTIEISVSDSGVGMVRESTERLFEDDCIIKDISPTSKIKSKGAGLGLKVTNRLARMLGPERGPGLQVNSIEGTGSVFSFTVIQQPIEEEDDEFFMGDINKNRSFCTLPEIPLELQDDKRNNSLRKFAKSRPKATELKSVEQIDFKLASLKRLGSMGQVARVLIVDDDLINIVALQALLSQFKVGVDSAYNGKQGIEKVISHPNKYKIIFMDCQMPVMDGFEATRQLMKMMKNEEIPIIPIVGCTAFSASDKIEECLESGMIEVINKPVLKERLKQVLEKYI